MNRELLSKLAIRNSSATMQLLSILIAAWSQYHDVRQVKVETLGDENEMRKASVE
jgi:hypothetical protein